MNIDKQYYSLKKYHKKHKSVTKELEEITSYVISDSNEQQSIYLRYINGGGLTSEQIEDAYAKVDELNNEAYKIIQENPQIAVKKEELQELSNQIKELSQNKFKLKDELLDGIYDELLPLMSLEHFKEQFDKTQIENYLYDVDKMLSHLNFMVNNGDVNIEDDTLLQIRYNYFRITDLNDDNDYIEREKIIKSC